MTSPIRVFAAAFLLTAPLAAQLFPGRLYSVSWPSAELTAGDVDGDGRADLVSSGTDMVVTLCDPAGGFLEPVHYPVGVASSNPALGDLNHDGVLDLLWTVNPATPQVQRRLGDGLGGFGAAAGFSCPASPSDVVVEDFDGDGDADVAVAGSATNVLSVLLSDGGSQLVPGQGAGTGSHPIALDVADMDADGDLDLVSCNDGTTDSITVLLGDGSGSFTPKPQVLDFHIPTDVGLSDIDEDGDFDAVVSGNTAYFVDRFFNSGTGTITLSSQPAPGMPGVAGLVMTDLDGDGFDDFVGRVGTSVYVLPGKAGPDFAAMKPSSPYGGFVSVLGLAVLDADSDGLRDLVVGGGSTDATVLLNRGFGELFEPARVVEFAECNDLVAADFDGDGTGDVAEAFFDSIETGSYKGIELRLNDGSGSIANTVVGGTWISNVPMDALAAGDLDADGDMDLVADPHDAGPQGLLAFYNGGGASFGAATSVSLGTPFSLRDLSCGDVDDDGDADVVVNWFGGYLITLSNGPSGFGTPTSVPAPDAGGLALADANLDGALDLLACNSSGLTLDAYLGNGAGAFPQKLTSPMPYSPKTLAAGDFDGDGDPDVASVSEWSPGKLMAATNNGAASFALSAQWPMQTLLAPVVADVDDDGLADILAISGSDVGTITLLRANGESSGSPWQEPQKYATASYPTGITCASMGHDAFLDVVTQGCKTFYIDVWGQPNYEVVGVTDTSVLNNMGAPEPWVHLGQGKAGAAGIPMLVGHGTLEAGEPMKLTLKGAKPLSPATLVIGTSAVFAPFKGGTMVPMPNFLLGMGTNASGGLDLAAAWPASVPTGVSLWFQMWSTDVVGLAASNGVSATTP